MGKTINILIASVGGQGGLTLSRVLAIAAVSSGYSVRTGESLGMSQRFGSVVSFVRIGIGEEVYAPTFGFGDADYIIGLELIETLRNIQYLKKEGKLIAADIVKVPTLAVIGKYKISREELISKLRCIVKDFVLVPATELALKAGSVRAINMVMLGVANQYLELFRDEVIEKAITYVLPGTKGEISVKAYRLGKEFALKLGKPKS